MLEHYGKFFSLRDAITDTATKFDAKESTVRVDWSRRDHWLKKLCGLDKNAAVIDQFIIDIMRILKDIELSERSEKNPSVRFAYKKLGLEGRFRLIDVLRELEFDTSIRGRIERLEEAAQEQGHSLYTSRSAMH